jgi:hypothetical protein
MARRRRTAATSWIDLSLDAYRLGVEAQAVIALRMLKLAAGGPAADLEGRRMVAEKVGAAMELSTKAAISAMTGAAPVGPAHALAHYRRKVRANTRRLLRP